MAKNKKKSSSSDDNDANQDISTKDGGSKGKILNIDHSSLSRPLYPN